jgi:hypothetical protein
MPAARIIPAVDFSGDIIANYHNKSLFATIDHKSAITGRARLRPLRGAFLIPSALLVVAD